MKNLPNSCEFLHYTVKSILITRCHDSVHILPFTSSEFELWYEFGIFVTLRSMSDLIVDRWPWMSLNESAVSLFDPWQTQRSAVFVLLLLWLIVSHLQSVFPSFLRSLFSDIEWMSFCLSVSVFVIVTYQSNMIVASRSFSLRFSFSLNLCI